MHKCQRRIHRAGRRKYFLVSDYANKAAEDEIGQTIGLIRVDQVFEPGEVLVMMLRVLAVGVDKDIDIKKNHAALP